MPSTRATVLALAAALPALAHYNFEALIVNGEITGPYEYVRKTTNANSPITDVTSSDMTCNQGGLDADIMAATDTMTVAPGDIVGFDINSEFGHPGPIAVYMSKAPDGTSAAEYKGDGDWFKVYDATTSYISTEDGLHWANYAGADETAITNFLFTLPEQLPPGDYLMRGEHIALHGAGEVGGAQHYMGCAQLTVTGSGSGSPSPLVKIPGVYKGTEPGLLINIYYPPPQNYTIPGPAAWPSGCEDHTANLLDGEYDGDCTESAGPPAA